VVEGVCTATPVVFELLKLFGPVQAADPVVRVMTGVAVNDKFNTLPKQTSAGVPLVFIWAVIFGFWNTVTV
jgi:uncharacterized membrane protein YedE/YeeE